MSGAAQIPAPAAQPAAWTRAGERPYAKGDRAGTKRWDDEVCQDLDNRDERGGMRRTFIMLPLGVALSVVLAACGGAERSAPATTQAVPNGAGTSTATTAPDPAPQTTTRSAPGTAPGTAPTQPAAAGCTGTQGWGTATKESAPYSPAPIYLTRIGRHECYDRVVFDLNGPEPIGYHVGYVPVVTEDGSGREIPVQGGAALQVIVRAWPQGSPGDESGRQPGRAFPRSGEYLHGPGGLENWGALRAVRAAGAFEGQSTFAVGTRDRLPFRVTTWVDSSRTAHVIVDIAHR